MDDLPELRADIPALEPDAVLLGQLVELSAASTAAVTARPKLRPVRALTMGAAALGLVAATSWIAGALPGVPSPIAPDPAPQQPAPTTPAPAPSHTNDPRVSGADLDPTSDASRPHAEASDVAPTPGQTPGWTPPGKPTEQPTSPGEGRSVGQGPGKHSDHGKHLGQNKQRPPKSDNGKSGSGNNGRQPSAKASPTRGGNLETPPTNDHASSP